MVSLSEVAYVFLHTRELHDTLVDRTLRDESVNGDLTSLAQTMGTIHGLRIVGGIPVVIIEDDGIGSGQVNSETTRSCTKQKYKYIGP